MYIVLSSITNKKITQRGKTKKREQNVFLKNDSPKRRQERRPKSKCKEKEHQRGPKSKLKNKKRNMNILNLNTEKNYKNINGLDNTIKKQIL